MWITFAINWSSLVIFLNFRLCEIQLGAQCLLGEHGPLKGENTPSFVHIITAEVKLLYFSHHGNVLRSFVGSLFISGLIRHHYETSTTGKGRLERLV